MSERRTISVSCEHSTNDVCVVGNEVALDIYRSVPSGAESFDAQGSSLIDVTIIYDKRHVETPEKGKKWPLNKGVKVVVCCTRTSRELNDSKVKVTYYGRGHTPIGSAMLYLTSVCISLDVDVNRIGAVTRLAKNKDSWTWGPNGKGAILLVNCDRDKMGSQGLDSESADLPNSADLKDMSPMILTAEGPDEIFDKYQVILHISASDATKLRVYCKGRYQYQQVLGGDKLSYEVQRGNNDEIFFSVEGLDFPDVDFSGLVYINLTFQKIPEKTEIFTEKVVFRLAPWIMTPNTQKPLEVYVCSVPDNEMFLKDLKILVNKVRCKMNICAHVDNRGDRWIQDEMEFGYTEAPHKRFPVVFDSPRNGKLKDFPFKQLLGPDFGYVTREPEKPTEVNNLDSFGNLEVSPPVTVDGKDYPLGRILYGCGLTESCLKMNKVVRDFLKAQQVQAPVELCSDWLTVGHVDEFMCFVPAPGKKGFRLLLASPWDCLKLFKEKQQAGHGKAVMFKGLNTKQRSIDEILEDEKLRSDAKHTQKCIDQNREIMMKELGLSEEDIIDIPMLYTLDAKLADSFFPNMVNMLVLGRFLGIPKPFGPIINGSCCLEEKVRSLLEPLGLSCVFIDDFVPYHKLLGEVHCGTNVIRKPFFTKWWECIP
ncbi:protein-arginine deiminase type-1-like [Rhinophrynus dorsalis]